MPCCHGRPKEQASSRSKVWRLLTKYPSILIAPALVLCIGVAVGVWGVVKLAEDQTSSKANSMTNLANGLALQMNEMMQPIFTLALRIGDKVSARSEAAFNNALLGDEIADIVNWANKSGIISEIVSAPDGFASAAYPGSSLAMGLMGFNALGGPTRNDALNLISTMNFQPQAVSLARLPYIDDPLGEPIMMVAYVYIFVKGPSRVVRNASDPNCPPAICYSAALNRSFWGQIGVMMNFGVITNALRDLARVNGGQFIIRSPPDFISPDPLHGYTLAASMHPPAADQTSVHRSVGLPLDGWVLYVAPSSGWAVVWRVPAAVAVSVIVVILSICIMVILLYRAQYLSLLESILPKAALRRIVRDAKNRGLIELELGLPGTAANKIISIMNDLLMTQPDGINLEDVLTVKAALTSSADVYKPLWLGKKMADFNMDADVASNMARALGTEDAPGDLVRSSVALPRSGSTMTPLVVASYTSIFAEAARAVRCSSLYSAFSFIIHQPSSADSMLMAPPQTCGSVETDLSLRLVGPSEPSCSTPCGLDPSLEACVTNVLRKHSGVDGGHRWAGGAAHLKVALNEGSSQNPLLTTLRESLELPSVPAMSPLDHALSSASNFTYDVFHLYEVSGGRPLSCLAYFCISSSGLMERLGISGAALTRWLMCIEDGYNVNNPYHNATHAADVLQTCHALLTAGGLTPSFVNNDIVHLAFYLAAIVHDVGHFGFTNDYLITTGHNVAIVFNDKAPLENMHVACAWSVLMQPGNNFLENLPKGDVMQLRSMVIDLVFGTDMKQHFSLLGQFNAMHHIGSEVLASALASAPSGSMSVSSKVGDALEKGYSRTLSLAACSVKLPPVPANNAERLLALQIALKCSDLGHSTASLDVHQRWVVQLEEELFRQGDVERARGLPISPLFDRRKQGVSKSQVGFYEIVCLPLYSSFCHVFPLASPLLRGACGNLAHWRSVQKTLQHSDRSSNNAN